MVRRLAMLVSLFVLIFVVVSCSADGADGDGYQAEEQGQLDVPQEEAAESAQTPELSEPSETHEQHEQQEDSAEQESSGTQGQNQIEVEYIRISPSEAEEMMLTVDVVILDVRTQEEFDGGHIPGAVLLPSFEVRENAVSVVPDFDQIILVYCRAGSRSAAAARELIDLGYTRVYDFGGINSWHGEIVGG